MTAYEAAKHYLDNLKHFGVATEGTILRLEPRDKGIAVVCEPGPDPALVAGHLHSRSREVLYNVNTGETLIRRDGWDRLEPEAEGWVSMPLPFLSTVHAEALDGVSLLFIPDDGMSYF